MVEESSLNTGRLPKFGLDLCNSPKQIGIGLRAFYLIREVVRKSWRWDNVVV